MVRHGAVRQGKHMAGAAGCGGDRLGKAGLGKALQARRDMVRRGKA
jgi:hypothetical protein